jgi:hypothetical protein
MVTDVDFALANVGAGVRAYAGLDKNTGARPQLPSFSRVLCALHRDLSDLGLAVLRSLSGLWQGVLTMVYDHGYTFSRGFMEEICDLEVQSYLPCRLGESTQDR